MTDDTPILEVRGLEKHYSRSTGLVDTLVRRHTDKIQAVDGVSMSIGTDEAKGIIGESGCGKTTLLETLIGLTKPTDGTILYEGQDVSTFDHHDWKEFRRNVQIIFQDPFNSLDPKFTVEETLREPLNIHSMGNQDERIYDVLKQVELRPPEHYIDRLPKQLSGGERQRVSIARALILEPKVLLADEPVSMLDVSTQASILRLIARLTDESGLGMLYISHDISTVSYVCDTMNVMYLGRIVESAPTMTLIDEPKHPYSEALIEAIPVPDPTADRTRTRIEGSPPEPINLGDGCRFRDRCPERMPICDQTPCFIETDQDHHVSCHLYYDHEEDAVDGPVQSTR